MPTMPKSTLFLQFFAIFLFHIIESFNFVTIHITIIIFLLTMNKIELINGVAIEAGISKAQAKAAVDATIKVMTTALVKGDKIALVGFGTLAVQEKAERKGVNPSTGAPITIPAKKVVKFKPSAELAEKVKQ